MWLHAKNAGALEYLLRMGADNVFWQQGDRYSMVSGGPYVWTNYGVPTIPQSIAMVHRTQRVPSVCAGVCSDYVGVLRDPAS